MYLKEEEIIEAAFLSNKEIRDRHLESLGVYNKLEKKLESFRDMNPKYVLNNEKVYKQTKEFKKFKKELDAAYREMRKYIFLFEEVIRNKSK